MGHGYLSIYGDNSKNGFSDNEIKTKVYFPMERQVLTLGSFFPVKVFFKLLWVGRKGGGRFHLTLCNGINLTQQGNPPDGYQQFWPFQAFPRDDRIIIILF